MSESAKLEELLQRIAGALERQAPPAPPENDLDAADAFVWHADRGWLEPVKAVNRVEMILLQGIDRVRDILLDNTRRFAKGLPANNVLLWGARGMGKSSLVKAAHATVNAETKSALVLVEIHREDIPTLPTFSRCCVTPSAGACCSATISPSTIKTRATNRSKRCSKAASRAGPTTSCSMPPPTAAICCRAT